MGLPADNTEDLETIKARWGCGSARCHRRHVMIPTSAPMYVRVAYAIRERYTAGESLADLAADYDLTVLVVDAIIRARTRDAAGDVLRQYWGEKQER